ncbi:MAG: hypothetical protein U0L05_08495 [Schaedlerella sp.]|nr:hypothetical protein [Schaedlerella sp.]
MKKRKIRIIKIILGIYLAFVGSMLFINVYKLQPSDLSFKITISVFFIITGIIYVVKNSRKILEKNKAIKIERILREKAAEEEKRQQELHSSSKFRTAPMRIIKPVSLEKIEEQKDIKKEKAKELVVNIEISNKEEKKEN